ncbi:GNAT family N-acetyltransferase [Streptomyces sp. NPDC058301]|uniref:GNAT family N-acetyltransferase n=1 Tax=Streptomyces sp. NPDC058301 TaxID=3346436 RepID=UPI0036E9D97E
MAGQPAERDLVIRPRRTEDLDDAAEALVAIHASDGYPVEGVDDPHGWLDSPKVIRAWIAALDGRVVGHVSINRPNGEEAVALWADQAGVPDTQIAVLARLFVLPEARGNDVGGRLMNAATTSAQMDGLRLVLDVMAKDAAAIRLYERLGWSHIGTTSHAYGDGQSIEAICFVSPEPAQTSSGSPERSE